jgi:2-dehydro-3-deoxyphosphogluconate aldolase/(4S)-4-hydroxy-2-oxoglutarate aldolase
MNQPSLFPALSASDRAQRQLNTRALLRRAGILPVVTIRSLDQARALAAALAKGGLDAIELTLRSDIAMQALGVLKRELPNVMVGAGTVRTPEQLKQVVDQGVDFIVTPGTPPALARALVDCPVPVVPGGATATELMALMDLGFDCVKLFPAVAVGGLALIKSLAGPLPDLQICPTGGIGEGNAADFLKQPNVICIGGSWMLAAEWLAEDRFDLIEAASRRARTLLSA